MKSLKSLILMFFTLSLVDLLLANKINSFRRILQHASITISPSFTNLTLGQMHDQDVKLYTYIQDETIMHIILEHPGKHWVGFGFGNQIQGSDAIIIEIINNTVVVSDCIGNGANPNVPENDTNFGGTDDVQLVEWSKDIITHTVTVHMMRKLNTGDINDFVIPGPGPQDVFFIWSNSPTIKDYTENNGTFSTVSLTLV